MLRGLYSAATALTSAQLRHDVTAHNISHYNVPGYRKLVAANSTFADTLAKSDGVGSGTYVRHNNTDFSFGSLENTGRRLDLAINGDAFFSVRTPEGDMYTRAGSFYLTPDGSLVNSEGNAVLDDGGSEIEFDANVTPNDIAVGPFGEISVGGASIAKLGLTSFEDNTKLVRAGTTLFQSLDDGNKIESQAFVRQGFRETSNVSSVDELIQMVAGMRQYEASQKVLSSIDQVIGRNTDPQSS